MSTTNLRQRPNVYAAILLAILLAAILVGLREAFSSDGITNDNNSHKLSGPVAAVKAPEGPCVRACEQCRTLGELIDELGPPEKVYSVVLRHVHGSNTKSVEFWYPSKGLDFVPTTPMSDGWFKPDTGVAMYACYVPRTVEAHIAQNDKIRDSEPHESQFGMMDSVTDWTGFEK